jgi:hypothetical protein
VLVLALALLTVPQQLQTQDIEHAAPHITQVLVCEWRRTLSSGLLVREGWHGREFELSRAGQKGRVGYRGVGLTSTGWGRVGVGSTTGLNE